MTTYKTSIKNTTPYVNYKFRVKATNQQGAGEWSAELGSLGPTPDIQFNFNKASGGTPFEDTDYNGTGETWMIHTFTSPGDFIVESNPRPFSVLVVGSGANGGGATGNCCDANLRHPGGGGRGGNYLLSEEDLPVTTHGVTIGTGSNKPSTLGVLTSADGPAGGAGGAGKHTGDGNGSPGGNGITTNISGADVGYCGGGGGGGRDNTPGSMGGGGVGGGAGKDGGGSGGGAYSDCCSYDNGGSPGGSGAANRGGGGGGAGCVSNGHNYTTSKAGGGGGSGVVIIAYRTG